MDEHEDLESWGAEEPPAGFAERVVAAHRVAIGQKAKARSRVWGAAALGGLAAAAAMAIFWPSSQVAMKGERAASERTQLSIGARAIAVLEPGAHVAWTGTNVTQDDGDVFYRVEPGSPFHVHTPAGDVTVHGTCFRVKIRSQKTEETDMKRRDMAAGAVGATLTALAFVGVYEGRVAVSHAQESVSLGAGESARLSGAGVQKTGDLAAGEKAFEAAGSDDPAMAANRNLAESVKDYKNRLGVIEEEKKSLEHQLASAQEKLAAVDGAAPVRNPFDLAPNDWAELARDGTIKYRLPCPRPKDWKPKQETLDKFGLAPGDVSTLREAYVKSNQRVWAQMKPLCAQAVGSAEVAEKLGASNCQHVVVDVAKAADEEAASEAMRLVGEIRAGLRPMPGPNEAMNPVERLFLILTGENKLFEGDLAQSMGPDEAHRLAFGDGICAQTSIFGGSGPRTPATK